MLAYMSNVISSEFVIGYDGEFANNTLFTISHGVYVQGT